MPHPAHPMASLSDARENCARFPALLQTLLALLATLLARPRALAAAWHTLAVHAAWDDDAAEYDQAEYDETSGYPWPEGHVRDGAYWAHLTHNHAIATRGFSTSSARAQIAASCRCPAAPPSPAAKPPARRPPSVLPCARSLPSHAAAHA